MDTEKGCAHRESLPGKGESDLRFLRGLAALANIDARIRTLSVLSPNAKDRSPVNLRDGSLPTLRHHEIELSPEDRQDRLDSGLTERGNAPHVRTSDAYRTRAESKRLED